MMRTIRTVGAAALALAIMGLGSAHAGDSKCFFKGAMFSDGARSCVPPPAASKRGRRHG